jgi:carboxyl-terminal processing protease
LNGNRGFLGKILLVLVTAVVTFSITMYTLGELGGLGGNYGISFDRKEVSSENIKKFNDVRSILKKAYFQDVDENVLLEGAIAGMADSLKDPYTVYFNKEQMRLFSEKTEGSYVGIGVTINMDNNGLLTIIEPFEGSPALEAGLIQGDKIIKVDDKDVTAIKDEDTVIKMIKGKENSIVKISVYRPAEGRSIDFEMPRKRIKVPNIKSELLQDQTGYIRIIMFDSEIASDFKKHLNELLAKKISRLIIDVRDNPGGAYEEVVAIVDRLIPEGTIVYTEDRNKHKNVEKSDRTELGLPLAILVNGNSASASEILAGAVKDHGKGVLVGTKTFGKGLVQTVLRLEDGAGLKVTISRYFTPSGVCIQGIGITPDITAESSDQYKGKPVSQIPHEKDEQLLRAIRALEEQK